MKKLIYLLISMIVMLVGVSSSTSASDRIPFYIYNAASEFKIDVDLMYALCTVESRCRSRAINHDDGTQTQKDRGVKSKSYGMFQIKISTAKALGFEPTTKVVTFVHKNGKTIKKVKTISNISKLLQPEINAWYAAKLLRHLYDKHRDTPKVISAYNAGRPVTSNSDYVGKVLQNYARYKIDKRF